MDIGKYKQAMSYLLNPNSTLKTFALNPDAKLSDNDLNPTSSFKKGGYVQREHFQKKGLSNQMAKELYGDYYKNAGITSWENATEQQKAKVKSLKNYYDVQRNKKYFQTKPITINNKKINLNIPNLKSSTVDSIQEGVKQLEEWKKAPNVKNWVDTFRNDFGKQSLFSTNLRKYIQGDKNLNEAIKKAFDEINVKSLLNKDQLKQLGTYTTEYLTKIRPQLGATPAAAKKQIQSSFQTIRDLNDLYKFDSNYHELSEIAEQIYGTDYTKANDIEKLKIENQLSNDINKYIEVLETNNARKVPNLKLPNEEDRIDILDSLKTEKGYKFQEGALRSRKFNIKDALLGYDVGTTAALRGQIKGAKRAVDEAVGLSATFEKAPGYTEATQFLKSKTNELKRFNIDKPFSEAFSAALEGDTSKVADYNKEALKFKTRFPNVDVPFIKYGNKLSDVEKHVKHFDDFSDPAKKSILNIAKEKGIVIKTDSLPLQALANKYLETTKAEGLDRASKLKEIGLSPKGHALNIDVIPGLSALSKTQAANVVGKLALGFSRVTGAPVNAALGALLNTPEMREKGFGRLDASLLGATKGVTQDLANFLAYAYRTPEALYKTFKEDPKTKKVRLEQFLENLGPQKFEFMDKITDNLSERISTKEYIDNLAQLEYEKELQKVMPSPSISETEVSDTDQYLNEELFKKQYKEKIFKQFPEFKQEYYYENKEPSITPKEGVFDFNISDLTQPQELAEGGRVKLKDGTDDPDEKPIIPIDPLSDDIKPKNIMDTKLSRRQVLGGLGVAAGLPVISKLMQEGKAIKAANVASKIKIEQTEGMYPWFPKLVEKVKKMGEPFEEKERLMVPSYKNDPRPFISRMPTGEEKLTKHIDGDTTFILREYPDGRIAVDIHSPRNQESFGETVSLYYRPKMKFKNYKGEVKMEPAEFKVIEPEPTYFANGPDDVDITFTEVPKNPNRSVVYADIEAAERFATGKIKDRKIIPVKQSLRNEMEEEPSTFIMRQSGELGSEARPEQIIKIPEEKATGGRVGFSGGGHAAIKFARMITDLINSLQQDLHFSSHIEKLYGPEAAKKQILSPYRIPEGTNKSKQSDILMRIDEIKQNLPKEYSGLINTLDNIEKNISNYNYISAGKKGEGLLDQLPESFNFEKLPLDLFPMEDPLNNAFIIFDPKRDRMAGRYIQRYSLDAKTGKGTIETYDAYDPVSKKMLDEKDWKLIGVDAREESGEITKKGLN